MPVPAKSDDLWRSISAAIEDCTGQSFDIEKVQPLAGGCINNAVIIVDGNLSYFVKLNSAQYGDMFEAEAEGLRELSAANALRAPQPVCFGTEGEHAWLVLENLGELRSRAAKDWSQLGRGLALMHRYHQKRYGWHRDNTIGSTPQINNYSDDWVEFLQRHRIGYQLDLAARNGYDARLQQRGRQLIDHLPQLFSSYIPDASLLHGDLWSGNIGFLPDGQPVLFDPAVYYGDREADIAMTELFGGFAVEFYQAYEDAWPLDQGYRIRKHLYNLYHLLNHLNLFGGGYLGQCESAIDRLLAQVR